MFYMVLKILIVFFSSFSIFSSESLAEESPISSLEKTRSYFEVRLYSSKPGAIKLVFKTRDKTCPQYSLGAYPLAVQSQFPNPANLSEKYLIEVDVITRGSCEGEVLKRLESSPVYFYVKGAQSLQLETMFESKFEYELSFVDIGETVSNGLVVTPKEVIEVLTQGPFTFE